MKKSKKYRKREQKYQKVQIAKDKSGKPKPGKEKRVEFP
jgi:hypothetical protein